MAFVLLMIFLIIIIMKLLINFVIFILLRIIEIFGVILRRGVDLEIL